MARDALETPRTRRARIAGLLAQPTRSASVVSAVASEIAAGALTAIDTATFGLFSSAVGTDSVSIAAGSRAATSGDNPWTSADVGRLIDLAGAGPSGGTLRTSIASYVSAGSITLADPAIATITPTSTSAVGLAVWGDPVNSLSGYSVPLATSPVSMSANRVGASSRGRIPLEYYSTSGVLVRAAQLTLDGFRFHGSSTRSGGPTLRCAAAQNQVSYPGNFGAGISSATLENWYAVFACANGDTDQVTFVVMPFLRCRTVPGSGVVTFNKTGEGQHTAVAATYNWANDVLAGTEVLVINESGSRVNGWSGRVARCTANTNAQLTLDDAGTIGFGDYLLPAPPGWRHYGYVGSFYVDTAEVRNFADDGKNVRSYGVNNTDPDWTTSGAMASYISVTWAGYVSPLSLGVWFYAVGSLSTASLGSWATYFSTDSSDHKQNDWYCNKEGTATSTYVGMFCQSLAYTQEMWVKMAGSLVASRISNTLQLRGWIEP